MAANGQSSWNEEVQVRAYGSNEVYPKIWLAFECLSLASLLVFFVWSCFIRQPRGDSTRPLPLKALIGSILSYACARIANIITLFLGIFQATVQQSYIVLFILNQIFYLIAIMLGFYIFWHVIHKLLERVTEKNANRGFALVAIIHCVLLGIMSAIAAAECAVYIAFIAKSIGGFTDLLLLAYEYSALSASLTIICWLASTEILGWAIFVFVKARGDRKAGLPALTIGIFFFFLINFVMAILQILYVLEQDVAPDYLDAARTIIEFICTIGIYAGVIWGFQQWSRVKMISTPRQKSMGDYEQQTSTEDSDSSDTSAASVRSSYHNAMHAQQQQQLRYSVPEGAPSGQQVHMWMPSR